MNVYLKNVLIFTPFFFAFNNFIKEVSIKKKNKDDVFTKRPMGFFPTQPQNVYNLTFCVISILYSTILGI